MWAKVKGFAVDTLIFGIHFTLWTTLFLTFAGVVSHVTGIGTKIRSWLGI